MRFLAIIFLCTLAAIAYGILHDQITARICVEYFTIGHPKIIESTSPTLLAFAWGVIATWWFGAALGIPLACVARIGRPPRVEPRELIRPILILLAVMGTTSAIAGVIGYAAATHDVVRLFEPLASAIPADRHNAFLTDLWAHNAAYAVGGIGGIFIAGLTAGKRNADRKALRTAACSTDLPRPQNPL
jgi:hypothetical protein